MSSAELGSSLAEVQRLMPQHVSAYLLETDKPHALGRLAVRRPELFPDADAAAAQYLATGRALVAAGYRHYEVSNFALPGRRARHNLRYWKGRAVLAAGVAAHGQAGRMRLADGVALADLERCGSLAPPFAAALDDSLTLGLARRRGERVRCTPRGWLVSNELLAALW